MGNLERIIRQAIRYNAEDIGSRILCPVCQSMHSATGELKALDSLFEELRRLMKNPQRFKIPPNLRSIGIFDMNISIEAYKTHSKTVDFLVGKKGAETSDIAIWVSHEYVEPSLRMLVEEKISFFQTKMEKRNNGFKITPRQWYLMRYWPEFTYGGTAYALKSCRKVPDVCSFYLFLFRRKVLEDSFFMTPNSSASNVCEVNSVCMSTPWMERLVPHLRNLNENEMLLDKEIDLPLTNYRQGDGFYGLLWLLFLANLGTHDPDAICLIEQMFPELVNKKDPPSLENEEEKPSIGVRICVQLKGEGGFERKEE